MEGGGSCRSSASIPVHAHDFSVETAPILQHHPQRRFACPPLVPLLPFQSRLHHMCVRGDQPRCVHNKTRAAGLLPCILLQRKGPIDQVNDLDSVAGSTVLISFIFKHEIGLGSDVVYIELKVHIPSTEKQSRIFPYGHAWIWQARIAIHHRPSIRLSQKSPRAACST